MKWRIILFCFLLSLVTICCRDNQNNHPHHSFDTMSLYYADYIPWVDLREFYTPPTHFLDSREPQICIYDRDSINDIINRLDSLCLIAIDIDDSRLNEYRFDDEDNGINTYYSIVFYSADKLDTLAIGSTHFDGMTFRGKYFEDSLTYFKVVDIIKRYDKKWAEDFEKYYYPYMWSDSTVTMYNRFPKEE